MSQSNVYARGWVPHTCIAMASTVRIFSRNSRTGNFKQIGLVQSFKPTDTRRMERARGIGFGDRVAEIVPGTTDVSITVTRMALYEENILESFGYHTGFNQGGTKAHVRTLAHQKNPFDINEVIVFHARRPQSGNLSTDVTPGGFFSGNNATAAPDNYTSFWYHDCWMNNWARTIEITGNLIYMEDVTIDVTWVSDGLEPAPYADTDAWDTHGLSCGEAEFQPDEFGTSPGGRLGGTAVQASGSVDANGDIRYNGKVIGNTHNGDHYDGNGNFVQGNGSKSASFADV